MDGSGVTCELRSPKVLPNMVESHARPDSGETLLRSRDVGRPPSPNAVGGMIPGRRYKITERTIRCVLQAGRPRALTGATQAVP